MNINSKIISSVIFFTFSVAGFMVRLPRVFHHFDKELHALFYFSAFIFLSILFPKKWFLSAVILSLFGIMIEIAQDYSNKISMRLIGKSIHGRFDIEDVRSNLIGLFIGILFFHFSKFLFKSNKQG